MATATSTVCTKQNLDKKKHNPTLTQVNQFIQIPRRTLQPLFLHIIPIVSLNNRIQTNSNPCKSSHVKCVVPPTFNM